MYCAQNQQSVSWANAVLNTGEESSILWFISRTDCTRQHPKDRSLGALFGEARLKSRLGNVESSVLAPAMSSNHLSFSRKGSMCLLFSMVVCFQATPEGSGGPEAQLCQGPTVTS